MNGPLVLFLLLLALAAFGPGPSDTPSLLDANLSGRDAFSYPVPELSADERRAFAVGNSFFKQNWVTAPSSTSSRDGLGPLYNARSCSACHARDGRSRPPEPGEPERSGLLVRIGVRVEGGPDRPHPVYGGQIQDRAIAGARPEAQVVIEKRPVHGSFADGTPFELEAPIYHLDELGCGPLGGDVALGARTAPQLIGLGLLEAIPADAILAQVDPEDRDRDGISGRPHWIGAALGRFGWKATQPSVRLQTAAAFVNDIGITSSLARDEAPGDPEIDEADFERVVFYSRVLAVPAVRGRPGDPVLAAGRRLFDSLRCSACHVSCLDSDPRADHAAFRGRSVEAYTDLLLHDLGPELADEKRDGDARPEEWRTAPLWGVGLIPVVSGHSRYLHDGRARDLAEAILWHGGEAFAAREGFRRATREEREQLLAFVRSL